ncbi:MAG: class I SAM-dependent methyltransferase [Acidobacteriota bacterium]|nr:class I SAM-dependent methyltransferase [Acidobacteriota bacterium]MDH3784972.1 class I SAM-dependent methyltransferase [Acidobacteriota bacterium]
MSRADHEQNRRSWNEATRAHNSHKRDEAAFLRDGGSTLFPEELDLLGPLAGRRLLHLQCNSGQDSLSLAALGADVLGVDISDVAIEHARTLSEESGIAARFERQDVYDWLENASERFDLVFASYGALCWLSDLKRWAGGIRDVLAPGGQLVVMEFHPVAMMLDRDWTVRHPYGTGGVRQVLEEGIGDYVADSGGGLTPSGHVEGVRAFSNPERCVEYAWSMGQILTAISSAGLHVDRFEEYPYVNGCTIWDDLRPREGRRYDLPEGMPSIPLMFGLQAGIGS